MEHQAVSVDSYVRLFRRLAVQHWRLVLVGFLLVSLLALGWAVLGLDTTYEATATLFLVPEKSDPAFLREFTAPAVNALYLAILRSRSLAQAVTEALPKESRDELTRRVVFRDYMVDVMNAVRRWTGGEVLVYSPSEIAVRELQEARMSFSVAKDGTVTITALAFSPRVAVDLANTYVDVLLSRSGAVARQQARGTRELLETLQTQARASQREAQDALRKFQMKTGVVKLPDEARVDLTSLAQLEGQLADIQINREIAQSRLAYLRGEREKVAGLTMAVDPAVQQLREKLTQLEARLAGLTDKYTEEHPSIMAVRSEIEDARARLKTALQPSQSPRPAGAPPLKPIESAQLARQMAELEVEIISAQVREEHLKQRIARAKRSLSAMNAREQEYSALVRTTENQAKVADMLSEKLTAARIGEQSQLRSIQVVDLAALPRQPSSKQALKIILLGLLGGLGLGTGLALVREYTTQVVETEQEVARSTGLPVLGSIPLAERAKQPAGSDESGPILFASTGDPHALPADACRAIRTAIDCHNPGEPLRTLLVTSPGAHEGKTTVLLNLARAFLETNRRLLLVDTDLRRPTMHRALQVPNEMGVAEVLRDGTVWPQAFRSVAPDMDFLPSGAKPANPGGLLASKQMETLLEAARERADLVLIDAPPVLAVADCLPLCRKVDGVVLVARFGVTRRRNLLRAKELLEKVGARVVGVVINGLSQRETRRYYAEYDHYVGARKGGRRKGKPRK